VRFNQATVPGWVSQEYVDITSGRVSITASILNLRSQASTSSLIVDRLPHGYSSRVLDRKNGFLKILAPSSLVVALRKSDLSKQGIKSSPSWSVNDGDNITPDAPQKALGSRRNQNVDVNVDQAPIDSKQTIKAAPQNNETVQSTMDLLAAPKRVSEKSHIIAPGDAISLVVFGESDLSIQNVRVPQGGQVSLPLIGAVSVAGKTTNEVEKDVYKLLSQGYVRNPRLSVSIFSYRPIFIRGAIRETGSFPFTEGLTIAKAIALAGGSKNSANKNGVSILRDGNVILDSLSIDSQVEVSSGDVISVSEEFGVSEDQATYVYLHGEVASPGEYLYRRGLTVEKAVVLAGGFTLRASRKKVSVTRYINKEEGEEPERLKKVRLYTPVQPGDIIDVGASWF
jgi:polysaccharide export outer membrane protein